MKFRFWNDLTANTALAAAGLTLMTGLAAAAENIGATEHTGTPGGVPTAADSSAAAPEPSAEPVLPFLASQPAAEAKPAAPPRNELVPGRPQGAQQRFTPSAEQMTNARKIVREAKDQGLPDRAAVIAVATSLQESKLQNLGHLGERNDHDSLGLFQQRPSTGWGTPEQITDPEYSANAFYNGLKRVEGWQDMPLTEAAQTVQVSAYPFAYAQWEEMAADIVLATYETGPYAGIGEPADDVDDKDKTDKAEAERDGDSGDKAEAEKDGGSDDKAEAEKDGDSDDKVDEDKGRKADDE